MFRLVLPLLLLGVLLGTPVRAGQQPAPAAGRGALAGMTAGKAVFDIRTGDPQQLLLALKVIEETAAGLRRQQVTPDFALTFRGAALPLLKRTIATEKPGEKAILTEVHERLAEFRAQQIPLEACQVAARMFKIEAAELDSSLAPVGNSIISLIGYQHQGYALVPMY
jgi:intracellular sulfur oxidation DsrE/DsrF family protein